MGFGRRLGEFLGFVEPEERDIYGLSYQQWVSYFTYQGNAYGVQLNQTLTGSTEPIDSNFSGFVDSGLKGNGVVFACIRARLQVLSQATFQWRQIRAGGPGDLFGNGDLAVLENPFGGSSTTSDLIARAELDTTLAGNFFAVRQGDRLRRLRPDRVDIMLDKPEEDPEAEVQGYLYWPGGRRSGRDPEIFDVAEMAHFAPIPDPIATYRGMSWLTPVCREIDADTSMTDHKSKFMDNGATPNLIVKFPAELSREAYNEWKKTLKEKSEGVQNAYKTMYLGGGADAVPVGANLRQIDFKVVQGAGETRIAAAAGVPAVVVGLSEGLASATYSNFGQARRLFADTTCRHFWQNLAGSLANIVTVPKRAQLWYDDSDIPFLQEDERDEADIQQILGTTIRGLLDAGFEADAVIDAVMADDLGRLKGKHTGLFSVQLQAPGSTKMPEGEAPGEVPVSGNGTKPEKQPAGTIVIGKPPVGAVVGK